MAKQISCTADFLNSLNALYFKTAIDILFFHRKTPLSLFYIKQLIDNN